MVVCEGGATCKGAGEPVDRGWSAKSAACMVGNEDRDRQAPCASAAAVRTIVAALLAAHGTHRAAELSFTRFEDLCSQAGQDA